MPAVARRCTDGRSLLLEGINLEGKGVMVLLRYGDTLTAGSYSLLTPGDSVADRGAAVAVRFLTGSQEYGLAIDSGTVTLALDGRGALDARVSGWGIQNAVRIGLEAAYEGLPVSADTVPCHFQR